MKASMSIGCAICTGRMVKGNPPPEQSCASRRGEPRLWSRWQGTHVAASLACHIRQLANSNCAVFLKPMNGAYEWFFAPQWNAFGHQISPAGVAAFAGWTAGGLAVSALLRSERVRRFLTKSGIEKN